MGFLRVDCEWAGGNAYANLHFIKVTGRSRGISVSQSYCCAWSSGYLQSELTDRIEQRRKQLFEDAGARLRAVVPKQAEPQRAGEEINRVWE